MVRSVPCTLKSGFLPDVCYLSVKFLIMMFFFSNGKCAFLCCITRYHSRVCGYQATWTKNWRLATSDSHAKSPTYSKVQIFRREYWIITCGKDLSMKWCYTRWVFNVKLLISMTKPRDRFIERLFPPCWTLPLHHINSGRELETCWDRQFPSGRESKMSSDKDEDWPGVATFSERKLSLSLMSQEKWRKSTTLGERKSVKTGNATNSALIKNEKEIRVAAVPVHRTHVFPCQGQSVCL